MKRGPGQNELGKGVSRKSLQSGRKQQHLEDSQRRAGGSTDTMKIPMLSAPSSPEHCPSELPVSAARTHLVVVPAPWDSTEP